MRALGFRWLGGSGGQQAVELALVLPALLMVLSGGIDFGMAYQALLGAGMAAEEAARVVSDALVRSGEVSENGGLPSWAQQSAVAAVASKAAALDMSRTSVEVSWVAPATEVVRRYRPYRFRVVVPDAPNETVTVNLAHRHGFQYWQPQVQARQVDGTYGVWGTVWDSVAVIQPQSVAYPHAHRYLDRYHTNTPWQQYPIGWSTGVVFNFIGFGFASGPFLPFVTIGAAAPVGPCLFPGMFGGCQWGTGTTMLAAPQAQVPVASGPADMAHRVSGTLSVTDTDNFLGQRAWQQGWSDLADDVDQTVGPYAVRVGDREVVVDTREGPAESVFVRPLRVRVRSTLRALTPLLAPFLDGRVIERSVVVQVRWERGW